MLFLVCESLARLSLGIVIAHNVVSNPNKRLDDLYGLEKGTGVLTLSVIGASTLIHKHHALKIPFSCNKIPSSLSNGPYHDFPIHCM